MAKVEKLIETVQEEEAKESQKIKYLAQFRNVIEKFEAINFKEAIDQLFGLEKNNGTMMDCLYQMSTTESSFESRGFKTDAKKGMMSLVTTVSVGNLELKIDCNVQQGLGLGADIRDVITQQLQEINLTKELTSSFVGADEKLNRKKSLISKIDVTDKLLEDQTVVRQITIKLDKQLFSLTIKSLAE